MYLLCDVFVRIKLLLLQAERSAGFVNTGLLKEILSVGTKMKPLKMCAQNCTKHEKTKKKYKKKYSIQIPNICTDLFNVARRVS